MKERKQIWYDNYHSLFNDGTMAMGDGVGACGDMTPKEVGELYSALKSYFENKKERIVIVHKYPEEKPFTCGKYIAYMKTGQRAIRYYDAITDRWDYDYFDSIVSWANIPEFEQDLE